MPRKGKIKKTEKRENKKKEKHIEESKEQFEEGLEEHIEETDEDISEDMFSDFMQPMHSQFIGWESSEPAEAPVLSRIEIPRLEQDVAGVETPTEKTDTTTGRAPTLNYAPASATDYKPRIEIEEEFRKYQMGEAPPPVLMPEINMGRGFRPELLDSREQMGIRHQAEIEPRTIDGERAREKNERRRLPFEGEDIEKKYRKVKL